MLKTEDNDGILLMRMEHGKANAVDIELLEGLRGALAEFAADDAKAVVVTGKGNIFSAGVDLFRLLEGGAQYLNNFLPVLSEALREIAEFPKPLVAAMNGHAIAGGCVLACACDYKVMAEDSGRVGVPELRVGVPFPAVPLELVRMIVPPKYLQEVVLLGRTYTPFEACERGLVDEVVAPDDLEERALEIAFEMASIGPETFALTKRQLRHATFDRMDLTAEFYDDEVEVLWRSEKSQAAIRRYLDKTVGTRSRQP